MTILNLVLLGAIAGLGMTVEYMLAGDIHALLSFWAGTVYGVGFSVYLAYFAEQEARKILREATGNEHD